MVPVTDLDEARIRRRDFLFHWANGVGGLAMMTMLANQRASATTPPTPGKAKSLIYLYMDGGPSHLDTFDPKPRLARDHGKTLPISFVRRQSSLKILGSPFAFRRHGQVGMDVSEIFPKLATRVDDITLVRTVVAQHREHPSANFFMNTGSALRGRPSLGSWLTYGLGSECDDLPGYVVLHTVGWPQGSLEVFGNGFFPAIQRFVPLNLAASPPLADCTPGDAEPAVQRAKLKSIQELSLLSPMAIPAQDTVASIAANYELAFRMQTSVPDVLDISSESKATQSLYGVDDPATEVFGRQCLIARRLVEKGVRVVVLLPPTDEGANRWDQHDSIDKMHRANAALIDHPMAGLLQDLQGRGLFDQTLVLWGGEFGRSPDSETYPNQPPGRDHHPDAFCMWLAGGGVKRGFVHGQTDEYGFAPVENPVHVHDLHATILHLFGIDHTRLTFRHGGRDFRLTDVHGHVVRDILA